MQELKLTEYLNGLKKLFDQYGVTTVYSFNRFDGNRRDGVVLWLDGVDDATANAITAYTDNYWNDDAGVPPELRSVCIAVSGVDMSKAHCVYSNGRFYGYAN